MNRFILILILTLNFQSWTVADDIRDFQIEGMSIGDSLLKFYDKQKLDKIKKTNDFKKKIHNKYCDDTKSNIYFDICIFTLKKDKKFKIESIAGFIDCKNDISFCYKKQKEIDKSIKKLFQSAKRDVYEYKHSGDKTGNTKEKDIVYLLKSKAEVGTAVIDYGIEWTNDEGRQDHLQVFVDSKKYAKFLKTSAW